MRDTPPRTLAARDRILAALCAAPDGKSLWIAAICYAAGASDITARKHIQQMVSDGLVAEQHDPVAKRYTYTLTDKGHAASTESDAAPEVGAALQEALQADSRRQDLEELRRQRAAQERQRAQAGNARKALEGMRAAGLEPKDSFPGSEVQWPYRCTICQHEGAVSYAQVRRGATCPHCLGDRNFRQRLAAEAVERVDRMHAAGLKPLGPYPGNRWKPWPYRCAVCGHTGTIQYNSVVRGGRCSWCRGDSDVAEKRHAATLRKQQISEKHRAVLTRRQQQDASRWYRAWHRRIRLVHKFHAAGWDLLEIYGDTRSAWPCRCRTCGSIAEVLYGSLVSNGQKGCDDCMAQNAEDRMLAVGWMPLEPYPGSTRPWRCRHQPCGQITDVVSNNATRGRQACPSCRKERSPQTS